MSLKQPFWLSHAASREQILQSSVNGIILCIDERFNSGTPKEELKESAKMALTSGIMLDAAQSMVIAKILNSDDLENIKKEIYDKLRHGDN